MFFDESVNSSGFKRKIYLLAATILGVLLSCIVYSLLEIIYLYSGASLRDGYAFLQWFQIILLILGAIGGFFLGRFWWRKIYIEKVWLKRRFK